MTQATRQHRLPRAIQCPHCRGQMNVTGRGKAPETFNFLRSLCTRDAD